MDNRPILPEPPATEEPPLQQTPDMLNQQPAQPQQLQQPQPLPSQPQQPIQTQNIDPTPPERPPEINPSNKKTGLIVLIAIVALLVTAIIIGAIYWFSVLNEANKAIDDQNGSGQTTDSIISVDGLMSAYESKKELNCNYNIDIDGKVYEVSEQADSDWNSHRITVIGDDSVNTTLMINEDAVYSWGYVTGGDEFAVKMPWGSYQTAQTNDLPDTIYTERFIIDNKNVLYNLVCSAIDDGVDYQIPERDWVNAGI
ncbi:hypothetical protein LJC64_05305 [Ruminococcaceae bacterium OttesenSCG-928-A11]|nr:hypothetical protein [Ruminococcaceae bacterium OttesenSCG-928-A11]